MLMYPDIISRRGPDKKTKIIRKEDNVLLRANNSRSLLCLKTFYFILIQVEIFCISKINGVKSDTF